MEWNDRDGGERLLAGPDGSGMVVLSFVLVVCNIDMASGYQPFEKEVKRQDEQAAGRTVWERKSERAWSVGSEGQ
ncbi:hypothetical protein [Paenibacillus tuaregi]|uniref:hypothetical protein n=1 Tax=Paenibacillus tuaregi TaxID=1816681 RepID=UPI000839927F|nr:hypothetical protein [Paenibacillus tuaregi]